MQTPRAPHRMAPSTPLSSGLATLCLLAIALGSACIDTNIGIVNATPEATITSHDDGDSVIMGATVPLRGSVFDDNDGPGELTATWLAGGEEICSDVDPDEDGNALCETVFDTLGIVRVTLEVRDRRNATGSDLVDLEVITGAAPSVTLTSPEDGSSWHIDDLVSFAAIAADPDGTAETLALAWTSSLSGNLDDLPTAPDPTGEAQGERQLVEGEHTITVTATDGHGYQASDSATITVSQIVDEDQDGFAVEDDCNDNDASIYPGAPEVPDDGIDQDCDGNDTVSCFEDSDLDTYGSEVVVLAADGDCTDAGESTVDTDCDDTDDTIYPGAADPYGDGIDQNCDGIDGVDADGDGHPAPDPALDASLEDCNDLDASIYPGAGDTMSDGIDQDCDGLDCESVQHTNAYFTYCPDAMIWTDGNDVCLASGYDALASVADTAENTTLSSLSLGASFWIGFNDKTSQGSFVWADGNSVTYTNWVSGEPNGAIVEDCVEFVGPNHANNPMWNDTQCSLTRHFACSRR